MGGSGLGFWTPLQQPVECREWQGAGRAREATQQMMSGDIWAGSGITGNCMEPALPSAGCEDLQGCAGHPLPSQGPWDTLAEGSIPAPCWTEQGSSCRGFVPSRAAEEVGGMKQERREMCAWCRRMVWCCWTRVCCELRGTGRSLGMRNSLLLPRDPWLSPHLWLPCDSSSSLGSPGTRDASHPFGQHSARETWFAREISKCQLDGNVPPVRSWLSPPIPTDSTQMLLPLHCLHLPLHGIRRDWHLRHF